MPLSDRSKQALQEFIDDEMLRAPMLFDQLIDNTTGLIRRDLALMPMALRSSAADLLQALSSRKDALARSFLRSLAQLANAKINPPPSLADARATLAQAQPVALSLVDETEVAIDVELAHTVERIKSEAEYELRELQTYTAALVGDMDLRSDHNPFSAETYARALWATGQALPLAKNLQVQFMRHASTPLAVLLRRSYAAATSRLDAQGVEPAAYRTVILPSGARRSRSVESTRNPDLRQVSQALSTISPALRAGTQAQRAPVHTLPTHTPPVHMSSAQPASGRSQPRADKLNDAGSLAAPPRSPSSQAQTLVAGLFESIRQDERVPADVLRLIMRLYAPALQLADIDAHRLIDEAHPLWVFINRLAYEAEMVPGTADPERGKLLRVAQSTVDHLAAEPRQTAALYTWGAHTLDVLMSQRLARRCERVASQIGALQKLEDRLLTAEGYLTTLNGALDTPNLDTVPADLMPKADLTLPVATQRWLDELKPGDWVRLILQGRWVQAQLLWPGERRELWLLGDGASDATWAMRRRALVKLFEAGLLKGLKQRSLVGRAARALHEISVMRAA